MYVADFETVNELNDCRVWAWGITKIGNVDFFEYDNNIESFFDWLEHECPIVYFHNAKFDTEFLFYELFHRGFTYVEDERKQTDKTFSILMSDKNQLYTVSICFKKTKRGKKKAVLYDSLKILPMSVREMAKAFDLPMRKGEIEYNEKREKDHKLTPKEIEYLRLDCTIVALSLKHMFDEGNTQMTIGGNALHEYKKIMGEKKMNYYFPEPQNDDYVRRSYRGGYVYVNPDKKEKEIGEGRVYDVNSLYPWVMYYKELPWGEPIYYTGKYVYDEDYPLYVCRVLVDIKVRDEFVPTLQIKGNPNYASNEYITKTIEPEIITVTSVDLAILQKHYYGTFVFLDGWKYKSSTKLFREYIDKWMTLKEKATKEKNKALRTICKLMLNSLYGKFGVNPEVVSRHVRFNAETEKVEFYLSEKEHRKPLYIAMASFITAYAREKTINSVQENYNRFLYCDTDSMHLERDEDVNGIEVDPVKLGAWDHESTFIRAKFLRQKTYFEQEIEAKSDSFLMTKNKIVCAGMPAAAYKWVTFENFKVGAFYPGRLQTKHVPGGIVLLDDIYTIKGKTT